MLFLAHVSHHCVSPRGVACSCAMTSTVPQNKCCHDHEIRLRKTIAGPLSYRSRRHSSLPAFAIRHRLQLLRIMGRRGRGRPRCERCNNHAPSRRVECSLCHRPVGPGCDPEACLSVEFPVSFCRDCSWPRVIVIAGSSRSRSSSRTQQQPEEEP